MPKRTPLFRQPLGQDSFDTSIQHTSLRMCWLLRLKLEAVSGALLVIAWLIMNGGSPLGWLAVVGTMCVTEALVHIIPCSPVQSFQLEPRREQAKQLVQRWGIERTVAVHPVLFLQLVPW
eukprot:3321207-Amphidinium_carterae.2